MKKKSWVNLIVVAHIETDADMLGMLYHLLFISTSIYLLQVNCSLILNLFIQQEKKGGNKQNNERKAIGTMGANGHRVPHEISKFGRLEDKDISE